MQTMPDAGYLYWRIEGNGGWRRYYEKALPLSEMYHFLLIFRERDASRATKSVKLGVAKPDNPDDVYPLTMSDVECIFKKAQHPKGRVYTMETAHLFKEYVSNEE